jgi:protein DJ-1
MPSALVLIANGTEEMELSVDYVWDKSVSFANYSNRSTIVYDTLVRAGVKCTSALVTSPGHSGLDETEPLAGAVQCSRGVRIVPDASLSQLSASTTVCVFHHVRSYSNVVMRFRENMTPSSFQAA